MSSTEPIDASVANDGGYPTGRVANKLPDFVPGWAGVVGLAVGAFVVAMVLQVVVIFGFVFVAVLVGVASQDPATAQAAGQMIGYGMLLGYLVWIPLIWAIVWFFDLPLPVEVPDRDGATWGAVATLVLVGLGLASTLFLPHEASPLAGGSVPDPSPIAVVGIFAAFVVGAVLEEFLFRGTIQGLFRDEFSAPAAILGANLLFVPLHLLNNLGQPLVTVASNLAIITLLGLVVGVLYERHRNVAVPAAVHALYNAAVVGAGLFG